MPGMKTQVRLLHGLGNTEFIEAEVKHRFPLHFHDTFVIQHIVGGADWCCCNNLTAARGEVFIHMPHAPHTGGSVGSENLRYRAIYPGADLFRELTGADVANVPGAGARVVRDPQFVSLVGDLLRDCADGPAAGGTRVRSQMKAVFETLLDSPQPARTKRSGSQPNLDKMKVARDYLSQHYSRDVTTAELSSVCHVSEYHLIRSFRRHFGITPRQFLISRRVGEAKRLIASGMTVASAAYECGFADQSHLNRYFKKVTGYTPGQLRG